MRITIENIKPGTICRYDDRVGPILIVVFRRRINPHPSVDATPLCVFSEIPESAESTNEEFFLPWVFIEPIKDAECPWLENKYTQDERAPTRDGIFHHSSKAKEDTWFPKIGEICYMDAGTGNHVIPVQVLYPEVIEKTFRVKDIWTHERYTTYLNRLKPYKKEEKIPLAKAVEDLIENGPTLGNTQFKKGRINFGPFDDIQFKKGTFKSGGIAEGPTIEKEHGGEFIIPCTLRVKPKPSKKDTVVRDVRKDLKRRSKAGIEKYGTTLDREDLSLKEWLQHAYEECLDQALYLKRAIRELDKPNGDELEAKD